MATLTGISPVLLVSDLERSVAYDGDRLGFQCDVYRDPADFATAKRDEATILLRRGRAAEAGPPRVAS